MKILTVTGASGGHIFPAVSFISALNEKYGGVDTLLVLPKRSLKSGIVVNSGKTEYISTVNIKSGISLKNFAALANFLKGSWESLRIILKFKPDIVVGFGSLDSIPILFFAWLFRIKTLIHEQNVLPGRANRLLAHFTDQVAVSYEKTKDYLKVSREKITTTGNPVRQSLKVIDRANALEALGLETNKFTILVMGGSQGSSRINSGFYKALSGLKDISKIQVIHLTGALDYESVKKSYQEMEIASKVLSFFDSMELLYSASDLVISRAGATTIAELKFFGLPAVMIPYPFAYAHQSSNAKILEEEGRAVIINDEELDSPKLRELLTDLLNHPEKLSAMRNNSKQAFENSAASVLGELAVSLL